MQVVAVNKMLADMSKKAQDSFAGVGKGMSLKPLQDVSVSLTQTNKAVADTAAGVHGAITKVTSVTRVYTDALEDTLTTYRGFNNAGAQVQQVVRGVGEAMEVLRTSVTTKDAGEALVKQAKATASEMKRALSEYNAALREGNVGAIEHGERLIQNLNDQIRTLRIRTREEGISEDAQREVIKIADDVARSLERQVNLVRQREKAASDKKAEIFNAESVKTAEQELRKLAEAQKAYDAALKSGDTGDRENAQSRITAAKEQLAFLKELADGELLTAEAKTKVNAIVQEAILLEESYQRARTRRREASDETDKKKREAQLIQETEVAYRRLTQAQGEYLAAVKSENNDRQEYWQKEIDASVEALRASQSAAEASSLTEAGKKKVLQITNDATQAEAKHRDAVRETRDRMDEQKKASEQAEQNMRRMVDQVERWLATMLVMRGLTSLWRGMIDYAASYYDAMNEIRIITGDSVEAAERMGASYRKMAQDMSVSSTEIAKAAVEFWRQGLPEEEVNERLKYTTAYAKISALEFDTAAELMTAAANGMGVSAERIADVWSYLGDKSASGADE